jgi:hypothetical protein
MSAVKVPQLESTGGESKQGNVTAILPGDDVGEFVGALASVLRETLARFEHSVGRITDIVQPGQADNGLIVALQDFDRLQQEFSALGNVLEHFAATATVTEGGITHSGHDAITAISLSHIKERLLRHLEGRIPQLTAAEAEEVVF